MSCVFVVAPRKLWNDVLGDGYVGIGALGDVDRYLQRVQESFIIKVRVCCALEESGKRES